MAEEQKSAFPQVLVVYEHREEVIVYAAAYSDHDCGEVYEDCRARHGNAKLLMAEEAA
jgi:hypothetical protein